MICYETVVVAQYSLLACTREGLVWLVEIVLVRRRKKRSGGIAGGKSPGQMLDLAHPIFENIKRGSQSSIIGQSIPLLNCVKKEGSALDLVFQAGLNSGEGGLSLWHLRYFAGMGKGPVLTVHSSVYRGMSGGCLCISFQGCATKVVEPSERRWMYCGGGPAPSEQLGTKIFQFCQRWSWCMDPRLYRHTQVWGIHILGRLWSQRLWYTWVFGGKIFKHRCISVLWPTHSSSTANL